MSRRTRLLPDERFVDVLREMGAEGPGLTLERFTALSGHGDQTIRRHFGNWTNLRTHTGHDQPHRRPPVISDERLLAEYARWRKRIREATARRAEKRRPDESSDASPST